MLTAARFRQRLCKSKLRQCYICNFMEYKIDTWKVESPRLSAVSNKNASNNHTNLRWTGSGRAHCRIGPLQDDDGVDRKLAESAARREVGFRFSVCHYTLSFPSVLEALCLIGHCQSVLVPFHPIVYNPIVYIISQQCSWRGYCKWIELKYGLY